MALLLALLQTGELDAHAATTPNPRDSRAAHRSRTTRLPVSQRKPRPTPTPTNKAGLK